MKIFGMVLRKVLKRGQIRPKGYGFAWYSDEYYGYGAGASKIIAYPVPLNILFRWARAFFYRLVMFGSAQDSVAFMSGYNYALKEMADLELKEKYDKIHGKGSDEGQ